ncbi:Cullin repeat-like-containing domain protein [Mycena galopus ATCC 62051]|nr:Cullin repeat-like-containing domain protein [Mycena galopus ATCC 62051]KAF8212749.1 Cullin repeat-like-containing domain protein [Mycena galopus ATCC 62051]
MATISPRLDVQQIWHSHLEPSISFMFRNERSLTKEAHAGIYTTIYNVIMGDEEHGQQLHSQLSAFYAAYTMELHDAAPKNDSLLLDYYDYKWARFSRGAAVVNRLFNYLNRDWVQLQRDAGRRDVKTVLNVALTQWKLNMFDPLSSRIEAQFDTEETPVTILRSKFASENLTVADLDTMYIRIRPRDIDIVSSKSA